MIRDILYYYFYILILLSIYFDGLKGSKKHYLSVFKFTYMFMPLFMAFQYGVGVDTAGYMNFYKYVPSIYNLNLHFFGLTRAQPFFIILCSLCKAITDDFVLIQIVQAILFFHSLYLLLKKLKLRYFLFIFIIYGEVFMTEMSGLRECLALSFCFYALLYYLDNRYKLFYTLVTIGVLFHTGVIIFYLIPLFRLFKKLNTQSYLIMFGIVLIVFVLFSQLRTYFSVIELSRADIVRREFRITSVLYYLILLCFIYYYSIIKGRNHRPDLIYLGTFSLVLLLAGNAYLEILYRYKSHFIVVYLYIIKDSYINMKRNYVIISLFLFCVVYMPISRFLVVTENYPKIDYYSVFDSDKTEADKKILYGKLPLFLN